MSLRIEMVVFYSKSETIRHLFFLLSLIMHVSFSDNASTRVSICPDATHHTLPCRFRQRSLLLPAMHALPATLLPPVICPTRCTPGRTDLTCALRGHFSLCPHPMHVRCLCYPHLSLSMSRLLTAELFPGLFPNPQPPTLPGCLAAAPANDH